MSLLDDRTAVVVDQHPLWRRAVEEVLTEVGVQVLATTSSPHEALTLVEAHEPDLLVTEGEMPGREMDGLACVALARESVPNLRVIVLSAYSDSDHVDEALAAGADAYVIKTAEADDLVSAVRQAFDPSIYLARNNSARSAEDRTQDKDDQRGGSSGLTRRELQILRLVAEGHSNAELARMLWVTEQTVKFHLSNVYRKLQVANRTEASMWAERAGLLLDRVPQTTT